MAELPPGNLGFDNSIIFTKAGLTHAGQKRGAKNPVSASIFLEKAMIFQRNRVFCVTN